MFTHRVQKDIEWFTARGISTSFTTAKDRRAVVRELYGTWFADNGLKLTRDYMVEFERDTEAEWRATYYYTHVAKITIKDPTKAVLFKLTWGGE